jgi:hypothetical protein
MDKNKDGRLSKAEFRARFKQDWYFRFSPLHTCPHAYYTHTHSRTYARARAHTHAHKAYTQANQTSSFDGGAVGRPDRLEKEELANVDDLLEVLYE